MKCWIFLICIMGCLVFFTNTPAAADEKTKTGEEDRIIAVGDGLTVTKGDVSRVVEYFEKNTPYRLPVSGYIKNTIMMKLFAKEAEALKVGEEKKPEESDFSYTFYLGSLYTDILMNDYLLDDVVIESYFYAHPNEYASYDEETRTYKMSPLTEGVKQDIRDKIVRAKKRDFQNEAYERLVEKYNVRICEEKSGDCN